MAIIDSKKDKFHFYNYVVKEIYIILKKKTHKLDPLKVTGIQIVHDYLSNSYPIVKIELVLSKELYYAIKKEKNTVTFKLRVQKYYRVGKEKEESVKTNAFSKTFKLIDDDEGDDVSVDQRKEEFPKGEENKIEAEVVNAEFFLFQADMIKKNRDIINDILISCNPTTAIGYLLTKAGIKNCLMSVADNSKVYDQIIIPPLNLKGAIAYIDTFYGLYKTGSMIYFDFNRTYILRFLSKTKAYADKEIEQICFYVLKSGSEFMDNISQVYKKGDDKTRKYMVVPPEGFGPESPNTSGFMTNPEDITVVTPDGGISQSGGSSNKNVILKKTLNPYIKSTYLAQKNSGDHAITITTKDVDFSLITPNKRFQVLFEDPKLNKKYKGEYYLSSLRVELSKSGGSKELVGAVELHLMKIK